MSHNFDLRLSEADLQNPDSIVGILNTWTDSDINNFLERAKGWSEALNYYAGNQWIQYNERTHRYEAIPITDANRIIDRPVTNHILRWVTGAVSRFTNKPSIIVDPNSDDPKDKTSAKLCEIIKDYMWEDQDKDSQYLEAALWGTICGPVFRKSIKKYTDKYVDTGSDQVQLRCVDSDIIPAFQIMFDGLPARFKDIGTIMHTQVRRVDDVKRQFVVSAPGYFPESAKLVKEEEIVSNSISYSEGIKSIVDGAGTFNPTSNQKSELKDSCIYKEVYVKPSRKYPKGIMICATSKQLLYFGDSPYYYQEGKIWHPFTMWGWGVMPGTLWPMGLVQQLIKLQKRINQIDALVAYICN